MVRPLVSWGPALQTALCSPGVHGSIGNTIHTQLQSTVYEVLASVLSLGQGECRWGAGPTLAQPCISYAVRGPAPEFLTALS